ncbi:MAG: HNH endonuclease [Halobacteriales archaeon]|nr:HNH endonuclease [Halobacteriales archaeon]
MAANYPDDWDRRRRHVYQRDEYTCQNCRRRGGPNGDLELHCHHIVPKGRGGSHRTSNLITLCEPCHRAVHNRHAIAPTASEDDAGTSWVIRLRSWWRTYKRIQRLLPN